LQTTPLGSVSDMHRRVRASRGLGGACTDNRADGGDGRRRMVCLAPVPLGTSPSPATAGDALDDSGFGRHRRRNSRRGTRCVRSNRVLAYSRSHLVVWPAAYQLCRSGLAPLGTEVRYFAVTVGLEGCFTQRVNLHMPRYEAVCCVRE